MAAEVITNSLKYNKNQTYLIFDGESCNLNLVSTVNKIWQLGFLLSTRDEIIEERNIYINWPDLKVSNDAARITGFNEYKVKSEGKDPLKVLQFFEQYLYDPKHRIVFFNGLNFDVYLINCWYRALGLQFDYTKFIDRCIDVRSLVVADKLGVKFNNEDNFLFWQYQMLNVIKRGLKSSLASSCKDYGIKLDKENFHDALFDVYQTRAVLFEMLKKFEIK